MHRKLLAFLIIPCCFALACGEYQGMSVCQRAQHVRMKTIITMCEDWEARECPWPCPCLCVDQGGDFLTLKIDGGFPNAESPCLLDVPCEGQAKESSEACLEDPETCSTAWARGFAEDFSWYGVPFCGEGAVIEEPFPPERCVYSSEWQELQEL